MNYKYYVHDEDGKIKDGVFDSFPEAYDYAQDGLYTVIEIFQTDDEDSSVVVWTWDDTRTKEEAFNDIEHLVNNLIDDSNISQDDYNFDDYNLDITKDDFIDDSLNDEIDNSLAHLEDDSLLNEWAKEDAENYREMTLDEFIEAGKKLGYELCQDDFDKYDEFYCNYANENFNYEDDVDLDEGYSANKYNSNDYSWIINNHKKFFQKVSDKDTKDLQFKKLKKEVYHNVKKHFGCSEKEANELIANAFDQYDIVYGRLTEGRQVQNYKGFELDWNEDNVDPEEGLADFRVDVIDRRTNNVVASANGFRAARQYIDDNNLNNELWVIKTEAAGTGDYYSENYKEFVDSTYFYDYEGDLESLFTSDINSAAKFTTEAEANKYAFDEEAFEMIWADDEKMKDVIKVVNIADIKESLTESNNTDEEHVEDTIVIKDDEFEDENAIEEVPKAQVETDCVTETATAVMAAYQNANRWLDTIKETVYYKLNSPILANYIHELAHKMPLEFDSFGTILHTANIEIPYPATEELEGKPANIIEAINATLTILDDIRAKLNNFIKCTDEKYHGMSCSAEELLMNIESEYPMLYRLLENAKKYVDDTITFEKYVLALVEHKDDLLD